MLYSKYVGLNFTSDESNIQLMVDLILDHQNHPWKSWMLIYQNDFVKPTKSYVCFIPRSKLNFYFTGQGIEYSDKFSTI